MRTARDINAANSRYEQRITDWTICSDVEVGLQVRTAKLRGHCNVIFILRDRYRRNLLCSVPFLLVDHIFVAVLGQQIIEYHCFWSFSCSFPSFLQLFFLQRRVLSENVSYPRLLTCTYDFN